MRKSKVMKEETTYRLEYSEEQGCFHYATKEIEGSNGFKTICDNLPHSKCSEFTHKMIEKYPNINTGEGDCPKFNDILSEFQLEYARKASANLGTYSTIIEAINPKDGKLSMYEGPNVPGISFKDAQDYCYKNGFGYCKVEGRLLGRITIKKGKIVEEVDYN